MSIDDDLREIRGSLAERVLVVVHRVGVTTSGDIADTLTAEAGAEPVEQMAVIQATSWLRQLDLAEQSTSLGGEFDLTARGHQAAAIVSRQKGSSNMLIQDCAKAMLAWLNADDVDHYPTPESMLESPQGEGFDEATVQKAAQWLHSHGLVKSVGQGWGGDYPLRVAISDDGRDCMIRFDGDIDAYLSQGAAKAGDQYNVNVSNASNLQVMQGSADGSQSWTQQLGASERQQVSDLAKQILEQVNALSLPEPRIQEIRDAAGQIRDARDDEDVSPGKIRALVGTITTAALSAMGTAAGTQILELSGQIVAALPG